MRLTQELLFFFGTSPMYSMWSCEVITTKFISLRDYQDQYLRSLMQYEARQMSNISPNLIIKLIHDGRWKYHVIMLLLFSFNSTLRLLSPVENGFKSFETIKLMSQNSQCVLCKVKGREFKASWSQGKLRRLFQPMRTQIWWQLTNHKPGKRAHERP